MEVNHLKNPTTLLSTSYRSAIRKIRDCRASGCWRVCDGSRESTLVRFIIKYFIHNKRRIKPDLSFKYIHIILKLIITLLFYLTTDYLWSLLKKTCWKKPELEMNATRTPPGNPTEWSSLVYDMICDDTWYFFNLQKPTMNSM